MGAPGAIAPGPPKTGVLSESTRRSESDKAGYVYYGLYVQKTYWSERVCNIVAVCTKLRQREVAYHQKMHDFPTHLGSKSVGIDAKCGTGVGRGPGDGKLAPEVRPLIRCRIGGPRKPNSAPLENKVGEWVVEE